MLVLSLRREFTEGPFAMRLDVAYSPIKMKYDEFQSAVGKLPRGLSLIHI